MWTGRIEGTDQIDDDISTRTPLCGRLYLNCSYLLRHLNFSTLENAIASDGDLSLSGKRSLDAQFCLLASLDERLLRAYLDFVRRLCGIDGFGPARHETNARGSAGIGVIDIETVLAPTHKLVNRRWDLGRHVNVARCDLLVGRVIMPPPYATNFEPIGHSVFAHHPPLQSRCCNWVPRRIECAYVDDGGLTLLSAVVPKARLEADEHRPNADRQFEVLLDCPPARFEQPG